MDLMYENEFNIELKNIGGKPLIVNSKWLSKFLQVIFVNFLKKLKFCQNNVLSHDLKHQKWLFF